MKHIYTALAIGALSAMSLSAQSKIDLAGRLMLEKLNTESAFRTEVVNPDAPFSINSKPVETTRIARLSTLVVLNDGYSAADLESAGFKVTTDLRSVAVVNVSSNDVERLAELDCVQQVSFGRTLETYLDQALSRHMIPSIHSGFEFGGQTHSFTGNGVCTGIYDTGVDANHIAFRNPDGSTRIKQLLHYYEDPADANQILISDYYDPTKFTTDDNTSTHGTHTTGIMAGGYKGLATWMYCYPEANEDGTPIVDANGKESWIGGLCESENPFYGVATKGDILISAGLLEDATSIDAFQKMSAYAKENGQPCVINYSVGSTTGPHDSSDAFSQAISEVVNEYGSIICVASGNSGATKSCLEKTFTATDNTLLSCVTPDASITEQGAYALIDIWADDATPFKLTINSFKPRYLFSGAKNEELISFDNAGANYNIASIAGAGIEQVGTLADHFKEAQIIVQSEVNKYNNRYHVMGIIYYFRADNFKSFVHLKIESQAGKSVMATISNLGEFTAQPAADASLAATVDGNDAATINDVACNPDVISVGAYNNRRYYATVGGQVSSIPYDSYVDNGYAYFSSYGKTFDGRQLPEVLGPGLNVIAPYSSYYVAEGYQYQSSEYMSATATDTESTHYFGAMSGTSMAAPFVSGTVALWLEADPTLTVNDVHEIIAKTSTLDAALAGDEIKSGAGRINPVEGLKEVLRRQLSGLGTIDADDVERNLIVDQQQGSISAFLTGEDALAASLYSAAGTLAAQAKASGNEVTLNTSSLAAGVYVLRVEGASGNSATRKVVIR